MRRLRLHEPRDRAHDRLAPRIDLRRPEDHPRAVLRRRLHDEFAVEALARAQPLVRYLVTHRAGDAVGRELLELGAVVLVERQVCEHLAFAAGRAGNLRRHRHVAFRALVLDGGRVHRMIDRFAPDARLPIRIACGVRHHGRAPRCADGHVFTAWRDQVVVARDAVFRQREERQVEVSRRVRRSSFLGFSRLRGAGRDGEEGEKPDGAGERNDSIHRHGSPQCQNSVRPPSNQSQRK